MSRAEFLWRTLAVVAIVAAAVAFLWTLLTGLHVLVLAFAGILLAIFLRGIGNALARALPRMNDDVGLVLATGLLVAAGAITGYLMAPHIADQIAQLADFVPRALEDLERYLRQQDATRELLDQIEGVGALLPRADVFARATGLFSASFGWLLNTVIVLFTGMFLAAQPRLYIDGMIRLVPAPHRQRAGEIFTAIGATLWRWLLGKLISMAATTVMASVGLLLLGVPLAITLGVIAGLLTFIPYLGAVLAAAFATLLALTVSPTLAIYVIILNIVIQAIESYLITPIVERKMIYLPPALTITAQVLAGLLVGPLGVLLATPMLAVAIVLVKTLYLEDFLGETIELPGRDE